MVQLSCLNYRICHTEPILKLVIALQIHFNLCYPITVDVVEIDSRDAASTGEETSVSEESPVVLHAHAGPDQRPDADAESLIIQVDGESDG